MPATLTPAASTLPIRTPAARMPVPGGDPA